MSIDYLIIGAGFSGAVLAERIATQLNKKVLVIERRKHIGGNCYDEKNEANILIHKYGPHLFHTNNKKVIDYLSQFTKWQPYEHKVLAHINGDNIPIPFNFNSIEALFDTHKAQTLINKLLAHYSKNSKIPILTLKKSVDSDLKFLADYIYDKVFRNYTAKQWGIHPDKLDTSVTARVPVFIGRDNRYFNDTYQQIPNKGYTHLFKTMLNHPNITLMLNTEYKDICKLKKDTFYLFNKKFEGKLIYTGQVDELFDFKFGKLSYRSTYMEFETLNQKQYQNATTINYPNDYTFTRITEFKHIHLSQSNQTTILKEYPQMHIQGKNTPYYPIFTEKNKIQYNQYKIYAKTIPNLILVGRLAEYQYFDMDDAIENALEKFKQLRKE